MCCCYMLGTNFIIGVAKVMFFREQLGVVFVQNCT